MWKVAWYGHVWRMCSALLYARSLCLLGQQSYDHVTSTVARLKAPPASVVVAKDVAVAGVEGGVGWSGSQSRSIDKRDTIAASAARLMLQGTPHQAGCYFCS